MYFELAYDDADAKIGFDKSTKPYTNSTEGDLYIPLKSDLYFGRYDKELIDTFSFYYVFKNFTFKGKEGFSFTKDIKIVPRQGEPPRDTFIREYLAHTLGLKDRLLSLYKYNFGDSYYKYYSTKDVIKFLI
jgi:hypothetical protein